MRHIELNSTPAALVAAPSAVAGLVVAAVGWVVGLHPLLWLALAVAAAAVSAFRLWLRAADAALARLGARPVKRGEQPRLENLVDGLCTTHGFQRPRLHIVEHDAVDAAAVGLRRPPAHLVVTRGALKALDRLELEAVLARGLCDIRRGVDHATVVASVSRIPLYRPIASRIARRVFEHRDMTETDMESVRLTSFPPGLVAALKKAAEAPEIGARPAVAHLWYVTPRGAALDARSPLSLVERIDMLQEM